MNRTVLILSALMLISITIFWAPGVIAMNRGKILQNIALWLAIFLGLALVYKTFGPEGTHPLFNAHGNLAPQQPVPEEKKDDKKDGEL